MDTRIELAKLRAAVGKVPNRGKATRFPSALIKRILEFVAGEQSKGISISEACRQLGIRNERVCAWRHQQANSKGDAFQSVEIVESPTTVAARRGIVVRGPSGLCIEGLAIGELVELLRRLG
jgi:transposase-like protein